MRLVASMITRNELGRYLPISIAALQRFCDEIRVYDDGSTDGTFEWLQDQDRVEVLQQPDPKGVFFRNEGHARNQLLSWTMMGHPTHVLAVDADEIVTDGAALVDACEMNAGGGVWTLKLEEIWKADEANMWVRVDGGWRLQDDRPIGIMWRVPPTQKVGKRPWRIMDRQLACGREPEAVRRITRPVHTGVSLLHVGWLNESERAARYARYVEHDNGRFHQRQHLDSIMWPDSRVKLRRRDWPPDLDQATLLEAAGLAEVAA